MKDRLVVENPVPELTDCVASLVEVIVYDFFGQMGERRAQICPHHGLVSREEHVHPEPEAQFGSHPSGRDLTALSELVARGENDPFATRPYLSVERGVVPPRRSIERLQVGRYRVAQTDLRSAQHREERLAELDIPTVERESSVHIVSGCDQIPSEPILRNNVYQQCVNAFMER